MSKKNQIENLSEMGLLQIKTNKISGREVISGDKTYIDYCSTNYLGFDFHEELFRQGEKFAREWGSLTGWSRLEADPVIYNDLEDRIKKFIGCKDVILSHTITITNFSVMPYLAKNGVVFIDREAHAVCYESARLARDHGSEIVTFKHQDVNDLEEKLKKYDHVENKIILVDGVYSISTEFAPIVELQALCDKYKAWLYVDDAHGFGVLGNEPSELNPYGNSGNGLVNYFAGNFKRTFYVSSFGKSFCTHTAFITIPDEYNKPLRENCMQYIYSAPISPYTIGNVNAVLDLNEKIGNEQRTKLCKITRLFVRELRGLGLKIDCNQSFPVVYWEIGEIDDLIGTAKVLFDSGVIAGLRPYPLVPKNKCGMRFGITCLHTEKQITETIAQIHNTVRKSKFNIKKVA